MNKIVLGSALVAVMGGVPGATYLLTQETSKNEIRSDSEPSTVGNTSHEETPTPANPGAREEEGSSTSCTPSGDENACPTANKGQV